MFTFKKQLVMRNYSKPGADDFKDGASSRQIHSSGPCTVSGDTHIQIHIYTQSCFLFLCRYYTGQVLLKRILYFIFTHESTLRSVLRSVCFHAAPERPRQCIYVTALHPSLALLHRNRDQETPTSTERAHLLTRYVPNCRTVPVSKHARRILGPEKCAEKRFP